jgi:NAD(P)H-flavin reductase
MKTNERELVQLPKTYQITSVIHDTHDIYTLVMAPREGRVLTFLPGQFNMLMHFGFGEVPISISGDPTDQKKLVHTIRAVGAVTHAMQRLKKGDEIGVRGPFGNDWPLDRKDCDVLVIAGGLGLAPLRSALMVLASHRNQYKKITLLYGTRTPEEILFKDDLKNWKEKGLDIHISIDKPFEGWNGHVGFVTTLIGQHVSSPQNTHVLICGPEIMMKVAAQELMKAKVDENAVFLSMERNMQCGVGFCGHCQFGPRFICKDGAIFSYEQLKTWLTIKEL